MSARLPHHYEGAPACVTLQDALLNTATQLRTDIDDLIAQLFVDSATWGLLLWESAYGLPRGEGQSYQNRREVIKAALRGSGTCTVQLILDTALAYTNAEVEVTEDTAHYHFVIKFIGKKGIPPNLETFCHSMDRIKPAHLSYSLAYTYTTWAEVKQRTWDTVKEATWDTLKLI